MQKLFQQFAGAKKRLKRLMRSGWADGTGLKPRR
jgi:hypothetical protein